MENLLGLPVLASAHGGQIDNLIVLFHWLMAVLFVGWAVYFVYTLIRFRATKNPTADYEGVKSHLTSYIETAVALFEAVLLIGFSMPIWGAVRNELPVESESTVVRLVAEQFAWNVHYPGPDGKFGRTSPELVNAETNPLGLDSSDPFAADDIATINQLHLPVDKPVIIHLSSKDVIHSFALQEMRVKQDAIPGFSIPVWFVPTLTTVEYRKIKEDPEVNFEISCAQLCGLGHYRMRGFLTIEAQDEFDAWLADQYPFGSGGDDEWDDF